MSFVMEPIGVIRTPFAEGDEIPIQPAFSQAAGQVEVYPEYAEGLQDIEGFTHIILIKPYVPEFDLKTDARAGWYDGRPEDGQTAQAVR